MAISYSYWHLVVKDNNFLLQLTSGGQKQKFHFPTDI